MLTLAQIEENVAKIDPSEGDGLIFDLLLAYGHPQASVARLKKGTLNQGRADDELLWRKKVYCRFLAAGKGDVHAAIDDAGRRDYVARANPRFLIVHDRERLVAVDTRTHETLDVELSRLAAHASFFLPWAGIEKAQLENLHYADIKAAEKMAKLYDEVRRVNDFTSDHAIHGLNLFFTRLLFCFFAEDTGIFSEGSITQAIGSLTHADGSDLPGLLDQLFEVLDTPATERESVPSYLADLGYVNGSLFSEKASAPVTSAKARQIILECGELNWSEINPDIFGSMMQAVVHPGERAGLGMHYTSVENIMRCLRPLFLDELDDAFESSLDDPKKLRRLLDRVAAIKVFDPACGSGNFLVIAYKELRSLENRILQRLEQLGDDPRGTGLFKESSIRLDHFYGIEIDDFASEVAKLGLWLAKHQMNVVFADLFGPRFPMIPLREAGHIHCANAASVRWEEICPPDGGEIYVCGNPPYLGSSMQTPTQKAELAAYFGPEEFSPNLDYISLWFLKGADYVRDGGAKLALVSTNSICQGDHVALLFPKLFARGVEIAFAHQSFRWSNSARGRAGVTCVVVGLALPNNAKKRLYAGATMRQVDHIGPYLYPTRSNVVVRRRAKPLGDIPEMLRGSQPTDGGHLNMSRAERDVIVAESPEAARFIRRYVGADDFLNGNERYCIWVADADAKEAGAIPSFAKRFEAVRRMRLAGSTTAQAMADRPYRFLQRPHRETSAIIVPRHSSESREYVPMGFLGPDTVVSDAANAVYDAEPWLFGLIQSRLHLMWLRAVGGQLETRLRYATTLVYNTFPVPPLTSEERAMLTAAALDVLVAREQFPELTVAQLYDPSRTPEMLRAAHLQLDEAVESSYDFGGFSSDDARLAELFAMYDEQTSSPTSALVNA